MFQRTCCVSALPYFKNTLEPLNPSPPVGLRYLFKRCFCGNWPLFVFLRRNHTRTETRCARKLFLDPTRTMVSSGNGPLPRCVVGLWPKLGHRRPLHIGGHQRCARSWYPPPPSLSFCRLSTMGFCVTEFFGHDNCYCHR